MNTVRSMTTTPHPGAEAAFTGITLNPAQWESDRVLHITSSNGNNEFTNADWSQYLERIIELAPRVLSIETSILTNISGASRLVSVEELYIGNEFIPVETNLMLKQPEILEMLKEIAQMPAIKAFAVASHVPYMGELNMQRNIIDCLQEIKNIFPSYLQCTHGKKGLRVNIKLPVHGEAF